jgi:hypothetical protein
MAAILRCGIRTFRTFTGPLSGEVHVSGGISRAKGARKRGGRARSRSLEPCTGPDDGSGITAGGSARTSAAPPADRETSGGSANGGGSETKRAPKKDEQVVPKLECTEAEIQPIEGLPDGGVQFVKAINARVQMVGVGAALLMDEDVKVRQRVFEQLVEIVYGKHARVAEEERPRKSSWNVPSGIRD